MNYISPLYTLSLAMYTRASYLSFKSLCNRCLIPSLSVYSALPVPTTPHTFKSTCYSASCRHNFVAALAILEQEFENKTSVDLEKITRKSEWRGKKKATVAVYICNNFLDGFFEDFLSVSCIQPNQRYLIGSHWDLLKFRILLFTHCWEDDMFYVLAFTTWVTLAISPSTSTAVSYLLSSTIIIIF